MKYVRLFLCLLLILTLSACGTDTTKPSAEHSNNPSAPTTTDPNSSSPAPADMWFNAEGQYGTVEYTYGQSGKLEKTIFYYHSGKVWRTIEHYAINEEYIGVISNRIAERYSAEESRIFEEILGTISRELMPETTEILDGIHPGAEE